MGTPEQPGLLPLSIKSIFQSIEARDQDCEYLLRVSFLEIYNEVLTDLLDPRAGPLKVHEDPHKGVFVGGAREEIVTSMDEVLSLIERGNQQRHIGETNMNEHSSRSHTIFRMVVESRSRREVEGEAVKVAMLTLVDLAGSERVKDTSAPPPLSLPLSSI